MNQPVSVAELRRRAVAAQGYAARSRRARAAEVEATIGRLGAVQLDSISAVERSHRIALTSRIGVYPRGTVSRLLGRGRVFEYWAHEACLVPIGDWPLYRRVMLGSDEHPWWGDVLAREPALTERVLAEIRDRGPLGSRDFEGEAQVGMWNLKPAKRVLEALWNSGRLVVCERRSFQRMYDLPERVIPDQVLGAPVPGEGEYLRALCLRAVTARGALTERAHPSVARVSRPEKVVTPTDRSRWLRLLPCGSHRLPRRVSLGAVAYVARRGPGREDPKFSSPPTHGWLPGSTPKGGLRRDEG